MTTFRASLIAAACLAGGSALAAPYGFLKADGMRGHIAREVQKPGSGPHAKDRVVRAEAFGNASDRHRPFHAYTEHHAPASASAPATLRWQHLDGKVDTHTGQVQVDKVETGTKKL